jgi:hypothetical protein
LNWLTEQSNWVRRLVSKATPAPAEEPAVTTEDVAAFTQIAARIRKDDLPIRLIVPPAVREELRDRAQVPLRALVEERATAMAAVYPDEERRQWVRRAMLAWAERQLGGERD